MFGDRASGAFQVQFGWTGIVRHPLVKGTASPDDPALAHYWANRRRKKTPPPLDKRGLRLLQAQHGRCPICGDFLLHVDLTRCPGQLDEDVPVQSIVFADVGDYADGSETGNCRLNGSARSVLVLVVLLTVARGRRYSAPAARLLSGRLLVRAGNEWRRECGRFPLRFLELAKRVW